MFKALLALSLFVATSSAFAETYVTPYGQILQSASPRIGVGLDSGAVYYRSSTGVISADNDFYARRVGNNIFTTNGVAVRTSGGYLAPNGMYYPFAAPGVVLGANPYGYGYPPNPYNTYVYGGSRGTTRSIHDIEKRRRAQAQYNSQLPQAYRMHPVTGARR